MHKKIVSILLLAVLLLAACQSGANLAAENQINDNDSAAENIEQNTSQAEESEAENDMEAEEPEEEQAAAPMEFIDGLGRTVLLEAYPETVISISASTTEIMYAIGAGDLIIGRDAYSLFPEEVQSIEVVGDFFGQVPSEALLAAEPDLILAGGIISAEQVATMEELGLTVYYQLDPVDFAGLFTNITDIGELLGHQEEAEQVVASLEARVAAVEDALIGIEDRPVVFVELDATEPSSPWTTGSGTFVDYIISTGGGQNAAAELTGAYAQMSSEALIAADPDVILLTDALYGVTPESVAERPGWEGISAVVNGAVYPFDPYLFNIPGPRLVDGLEQVAQLLHPEVFE